MLRSHSYHWDSQHYDWVRDTIPSNRNFNSIRSALPALTQFVPDEMQDYHTLEEACPGTTDLPPDVTDLPELIDLEVDSSSIPIRSQVTPSPTSSSYDDYFRCVEEHPFWNVDIKVVKINNDRPLKVDIDEAAETTR